MTIDTTKLHIALLAGRARAATVQTGAGPVTGYREGRRMGPEHSWRTYETLFGESPSGEWTAWLRDGRYTHGYRYPAGASASERAAIRRVVDRLEEMPFVLYPPIADDDEEG